MTLVIWAVVAWQEVRAHPLRSMLTILAVAIGVAALAAIVLASSLASTALQHRTEVESGRQATLQVSVASEDSQGTARIPPQTLEDLLTNENGVLAVSPFQSTNALIDGVGVEAVIVDDDYQEIRLVEMMEGRWFDGDARWRVPVLVVNEQLRHSLSTSEDDWIQIDLLGWQGLAHVIGVINDGIPTGRIYVASDGNQGPFTSSSFLLRVDPVRVAEVQSAIQAHTNLAFPDARSDITRLDDAEEIQTLNRVMGWLLLAVATVSLVVSSIGIINIGLVSVRARSREFAILRAVGGTRGDVVGTVITESVLLALVGGLLGSGLGLVLGVSLAQLAPGQVLIEQVGAAQIIQAEMIGFAVSATVGLIAGLIPALAARRASIVEVLHR